MLGKIRSIGQQQTVFAHWWHAVFWQAKHPGALMPKMYMDMDMMAALFSATGSPPRTFANSIAGLNTSAKEASRARRGLFVMDAKLVA